MIPNLRLSSVPLYAPFQAPRDRVKSPLVDYHLGGTDIDDAAAGLRVKIWSGRYVDGQVELWAIGVLPTSVLTVADVANFSFCFDQQMRPAIAYELTGGGSELYWYNPGDAEYQTLAISGASSPRVTLDDSRPGNLDESDVLLTYLRAGNLYFRAQRDAFEDEYLLKENMGSVLLGRFGMNQRQAIQWQLVQALAADPTFPPDTLLRALDTVPWFGEVGLGVWLAACGEGANWPGASIEISRDDGDTWQFVGTITAQATMGELVATLADHAAYPPADETNTLEVRLLTPGAVLTSVDSSLLDAPFNFALVEAEQLQFADAAQDSGQVYDLDYLLRGRNGTTTEEHLADARFTLLDGSLLFLPLEPEDVGEELMFRATTLGAPGPSGSDTLTFQGLSAGGS